MPDAAPSPPRATTWLFVATAMAFPTAMALLYFSAMGGTGKPNPAQQVAYAGGKILQFTLPVLFLVFVARRWPTWERPAPSGLLLGVGFGLLVGGVMLAAYFGWLRSSPL